MARNRRAARAAAKADRIAREAAQARHAADGAPPEAAPSPTPPPASSPASPPTPAVGKASDAAPDAGPAPLWIEGLARVIRASAAGSRAAARTSLGCHVDGTRSRLFLPPEMPTLQPASLAWLTRFAAGNGFALVEDRRRRAETPAAERRGEVPPAIALGLGLLMRQTGLPGPVPRLSAPHRLAADAPFVDLPELVAMAASAAPRAKRVTVLPSRPLVDVLGGDTHPVHGYGCRLDSAPARTVLTHFDAPSLKAIGYSSGRQYVMHLLLGGGPAIAPRLWTRPATLARTDVRFRLFRAAKDRRMDFGLLYTTLYLDMAERRPEPWWLGDAAFTDARAGARAVPAEAGLALAG